MSLDLSILYALNSFVGRSPLADQTALFFAQYLAYIAVALALALILFSTHTWRTKAVILALSFGAGLLTRYGVASLIRHFWNRPRPYTALPDSVHALFTDPAWSFPSGHASFFFALSTVLYCYDKRWGIGFFALSVLITLGRVAAGVHYPSDILAGAVLGALVGWLVYRFVRPMVQKVVNSTY